MNTFVFKGWTCAADLLSGIRNCTITFWLVFSFKSECNHSLTSLYKGGFVFLRPFTFSVMSKTTEVAGAHLLRFCAWPKIERLHARYECSLIRKMTGVSANRSLEQCETSLGGPRHRWLRSNREQPGAPGLIALCQPWPTSSRCLCYVRPLYKVRMIDCTRYVKQLWGSLQFRVW